MPTISRSMLRTVESFHDRLNLVRLLELSTHSIPGGISKSDATFTSASPKFPTSSWYLSIFLLSCDVKSPETFCLALASGTWRLQRMHMEATTTAFWMLLTIDRHMITKVGVVLSDY